MTFLLLLLGVLSAPLVAADGNCSAAPLMNVSMRGNDLQPVTHRNATSAAECCGMCATHPKCTVWTWVVSSPKPDYNHVCWFKTSTEGWENITEHISGITAPPEPPTPPPAPTPPPPPAPLPPPKKPTRVCKTCKSPIHSWDKLPAFIHGCEQNGPNGGLTPQDLEIVKNFKLVTLEKWQGDEVVPYMWEEDSWVVAAKQIKAASPDTVVIVWLDSFRIYTANKTLNPDLGPSCTTGHFQPSIFLETHPDMLLMNTSGKPALEPWSRCHIWDFTKSYVQANWTEMCLKMTDSGVIDGCGADASWQIDPTGGTTSNKTRIAWDIGHRTMMRDTTLALGNGLLLGKDPWEVGWHVNGALHEGCSASNTTINTLMTLTAQAASNPRPGSNFSGPLVYECHGKGLVDEVAAFLIGAGPYHYYGFGSWGSFNDHYDPDLMDKPLGDPLSDGVYDSVTGSWERTFSSGTKVVFYTSNNTGTIQWSTSS